MTEAVAQDSAVAPNRKAQRGESLWSKALIKFQRDMWGIASLMVVLIYLVIAIGVWAGAWGTDWNTLTDTLNAPASSEHWFGTNRNGQDIFERGIFSTKTAFEIGLIVALLSTIIGGILGAVSGFFAGSWIDEVVLWIKGVLDSIPFYLFVAAVAFALSGFAWSMHIAMIATFWTTTSRLVRAEVIRLKNFEFVEAAHAIGVPEWRIISRHILPNTTHILLVQATITFVSAIKSEVILSFLGLGVKNGVSWGLMISESTNEVTSGFFNNFLVASVFLFILVMAFNLFSDSLQDALDPKKTH